MKLVREDMKRHDEEFSKMREEFSKRDNLWATLLQEIPHDRAKNYLNQSLGMGRAFFERFLIFLSLVLFFSLNLKRLIFFGQKKTF